MTKELTRQEKEAVIMEEISCKDLTFGCLVKVKDETYCSKDNILHYGGGVPSVGLSLYQLLKNGQQSFNVIIPRYKKYDKELEIICHPVMIGDVLDWIDKLNQGLGEDHIKVGNSVRHKFDTKIKIIEDKRKELRKPISYQSDSCVDYIYSLIQQVKG